MRSITSLCFPALLLLMLIAHTGAGSATIRTTQKASLAASAARLPLRSSAAACAVTLPLEGNSNSLPNGNYGNAALQTGLWYGGRVVFEPGGPGSIEPDGALSMKWWWWRGVQGSLAIEGRRLDAPAPPLRSSIPPGYGDIGFQSSGL